MADIEHPLAVWMADHNLNDAAVAEKARTISRSQVNRIRRGVSRPDRPTAVALEKVTGIPVGDLMAAPLVRETEGHNAEAPPG